ncbi:MAG TPA: DUF3108 domain-containing protein [Geminicoccaceae bacterium]
MPAVALICCLLALLGPTGATAAERLEATYELLWGGLEIGRFETRLRADEATYRLAYGARTTSFLAWLFPFTALGASEGVIGDPGPVPTRYRGESRRRAGRSTWTVEFGPDGDAIRIEVKVPEDEQRDPVPPALQAAPDPLALALRATRAAAPGARFEEVSFDGKRAVRVELVCAEREHPVALEFEAVSIAQALACSVDGEVAAGASRRWQSARDADRAPATVLLSREIVPGRYWPVRAEAETRFGRVIARLTGFVR